MANGDVKVREVRLLESYSTAYNRFMESTIQMTYRFRNLFAQKDDQARDLEHKIKDHLNIAQQKLAHAKADYEASVKRGGGMDGQELAHREQALEKYLWKNIKLFIKKLRTMQNQPRSSIRISMESLNVWSG